MITRIGSVAVLVHDAKKSAEWYRDRLGFEIVGIEGHTVFVKPNGSQDPLVHLCELCESWEQDKPRGRTGIWLQCGEIMIHKDEKLARSYHRATPKMLRGRTSS